MFGLVTIYHDRAVKRPFSNGITEFKNEIEVHKHLKTNILENNYLIGTTDWSSSENDMFLTMERCDTTLSNIKEKMYQT